MPRTDNAWDVVPNLASEVVSPTDSVYELEQKIVEYFQVGVDLVWVVYPSQNKVHVLVGPTQIQVLTPTDVLDGGACCLAFDFRLRSCSRSRRRMWSWLKNPLCHVLDMNDPTWYTIDENLATRERHTVNLDEALALAKKYVMEVRPFYESGEQAIAATRFGFSRSSNEFIEIDIQPSERNRCQNRAAAQTDAVDYSPNSRTV